MSLDTSTNMLTSSADIPTTNEKNNEPATTSPDNTRTGTPRCTNFVRGEIQFPSQFNWKLLPSAFTGQPTATEFLDPLVPSLVQITKNLNVDTYYQGLGN